MKAPDTRWARLVVATRPGRRGGARGSGRRFRTERLLPAGEGEGWRAGRWILEPLVYQDEALGYFLFSAGVGEPAVYDTLREQLSSALKGALLLEQVRTHERRLEVEVARRTAELTRANRELTREAARRQMLEREVLGDVQPHDAAHRPGPARRPEPAPGRDRHARLRAAGGHRRARTRPRPGRWTRSASCWRIPLRAQSRLPAASTRRGWPSTALSAAIEELVAAARQQARPRSWSSVRIPGFAWRTPSGPRTSTASCRRRSTNALKHSGRSESR